MKLLATAVLVVAAQLMSCASTPNTSTRAATTESPTTAPLNANLPTIFVAGDSTAAKGSDPEQQGWGEPFADFFDRNKINIANRARGGRSSRTFITEGHWDRMLVEMKSGDIVIIQFGHNDSGALNEEPPGSQYPLRARGSIGGLGDETREIDNVLTKQHEVVHSFGWYIRKMIADARAKGATPIVMSLTVRNEWQDGKVERGPGKYRAWDREIASQTGVRFVDLTGIIAFRYEKLSPVSVREFFPKDHTHTNPAGAELNAECVVAGLRASLKDSIKERLSRRGLQVRAENNPSF